MFETNNTKLVCVLCKLCECEKYTQILMINNPGISPGCLIITHNQMDTVKPNILRNSYLSGQNQLWWYTVFSNNNEMGRLCI